MQPDQSTYVHRPVYGLPTSLLASEGRTVAVIALMTRQAGLNRELRRAMGSRAKASRDLGIRLEGKIPSPELNVLSYYLRAKTRFESFWIAAVCILEPHGAMGSRAYACAVDVQLLNAFEPNWPRLPLDEQALTESCPEWPRIKAQVEKANNIKSAKLPLGLFMLWPRIANELSRWTELDADRRLKLGHAVFALSSVGLTDWFIRQALEICPDLNAELGGLRTRPSEDPAQPAPIGDVDSADLADLSEQEETAVAQGHAGWDSLIQRLGELATELTERPTQEAVSELAALVGALEEHRATLPHRDQPVAQQLAARLAELMAHLRSLAGRDGLQWLDDDLMGQIDARWHLATHHRLEPEQVAELAEDAATAVHRTESAAAELASALVEVDRCRIAVADADALLERAKGFVEQAAGKRRRSEALKQHLDAEARQQAQQENLIDAASPFGEPFDYSADYRAMLECRTPLGPPRGEAPAPPPESAATTPSGTPADPAPGPVAVHEEQPEPDTTTVQVPPSEPDHFEALETAEAAAKVFQQEPWKPTAAPSPDQESAPPPVPAQQEPLAGEQPYSDAAGEACRPIWQLLSLREPALAFHAASWIASKNPVVKVPSPHLLAAVALESALMLPDGGIQSALSARFERLQPEDFSTQRV